MGNDILERQKSQGWGSKVILRLSEDLRASFPRMKGLSRSNLMYMRAFAKTWSMDEIVQAPLGQLPWYHHLALMGKLSTREDRIAYARLAVENGWSHDAMVHHIELGTAERIGVAQTNFDVTLPPVHSDLAVQCLKDPYKFDFLGLGKEADEREIEDALAKHVTEFLLELGTGFAYVGRQVNLEVGKKDFFVDLLFYHTDLHCYVVIELKTGEFQPGHLGQLSFYVTAVDRLKKTEHDAPTIGLLLCKTKNRIVAEYALQGHQLPLGISEYELTRAVPEKLKSSLPTIEEIERGLGGD